jgi:dTDP-4-amino-4,6-dideoxygalactose transaminase
MEKIMKIARKYNLYVIEDCSHAHWSKLKWKNCWTFWDVAVFSLQTNKAIFCWEWWILLTNNDDIYERATLFWHYRDRSKMEIKSDLRKDLWATWYWLKLRMSPFNAIVWIYSLENFIKNKESKHKCLKYLNERLKEVKYIDPLEIDYDNVDMWAWYWFKPLYNWALWINTEELIKIFEKFNLDISIPSWWSLINYRLYTSENNLLYKWIKSYKNLENSLPNSTFLDLNSLSFPTFYDWENHKNIIDKYIDILIYIWENITNLTKND